MSLNEVFPGCRSQTAYLFCGTEHKKQVNFTELTGCKKTRQNCKIVFRTSNVPRFRVFFCKKAKQG